MDSTRRFNSFIAGLMYLGLFELLTGIGLIPFYRSLGARAYEATLAISKNPVLEIVRAVHHWSSAILIIASGFVVIYGLWTGAYKRTTKLTWVIAVALPVLFVMLQLTGHIIPADRHAIRTAVIETGIAQSVPIVGPMTATMMRGGKAASTDTIVIWSYAHMAVFPGTFLIVGLILLGVFKRVESSRRLSLYTAGGLLAAGVILSFLVPLKLGPAATPVDYNSFNTLPEWYILPMHTLLDLFQRINPSLGFIGTVVLPTLAVAFLFLLPWIDRKPLEEGGRPRLGQAAAGIGVVSLMVLGGMSIQGMASPAGVTEFGDTQLTSVSPLIKADPQLIAKGAKLTETNGCLDCHTIKGKGGDNGPVLDDEGTTHGDVNWQIKHLQNPRSVNPGSTMPKYDSLPQGSLQAMAAYLTSLKK